MAVFYPVFVVTITSTVLTTHFDLRIAHDFDNILKEKDDLQEYYKLHFHPCFV
ncbi:hypothetical protein EWM64_g4221 [Hericium alpestre]|uniref:Uncharacterized protein n=1 Tax=Hericium alpestre TaxID=135208 RepID=A0A4Y9ZY99_9AGAM|nr:hypothetical protein EWM64_g4221 [Hericium alpestre]